MQATGANKRPGCGRGRRRQPVPLLRLLLVAVGSYVVVSCYSCSHPRGALAFRPPAPACSSVRSSLRIRAPLAGLVRSPSSRLTSRPTTTAPLHAWPTSRDPTSFARDFPVTAARVGITVLGTLLTYVAHANQRCSPVLASAAVTCAASLIAPGLGQVGIGALRSRW